MVVALPPPSARPPADDGAEQRTHGSMHARAPFVPHSHRTYLQHRAELLADVVVDIDGGAYAARVAADVRASDPADDEGWCSRVWDRYMRESAERGFARDGETTTPEVTPESDLRDDPQEEDEMGRESPTRDAVEAAYKKLSADGSRPTSLDVARAAGLEGPDEAIIKRVDVSLYVLRKLGRLPKAEPRTGRARVASAPKKPQPKAAPAPASPRRSRSTASSPSSAPAPVALDGVVAQLREQRAALTAAVERIDRALDALGAA